MISPSSYPSQGRPNLTLDNCESVEVWLATEPPQSTQVIVHRDRKPLIRPVPLKPIRSLRAGDLVVFDGEKRVVARVGAYR